MAVKKQTLQPLKIVDSVLVHIYVSGCCIALRILLQGELLVALCKQPAVHLAIFRLALKVRRRHFGLV